LAYNIASHLRSNGVNGLGPCVMFNGVEGFIPQANSKSVISGLVSKGIANGVMGNGGSVPVTEVVGNGVMVSENLGNGVNESVQEVLDNGAMVNDVGRPASQVMNNVNGLVSQVDVVAGGVMGNGFVREVANGLMENGISGVSVAGARVMNNGDAGVQSFSLGRAVAGSAPRVNRDRLLRNFNQEIRKDIARLMEYRSYEAIESIMAKNV
nr:hypothetical protein [Tanacetum cinerariifolium]